MCAGLFLDFLRDSCRGLCVRLMIKGSDLGLVSEVIMFWVSLQGFVVHKQISGSGFLGYVTLTGCKQGVKFNIEGSFEELGSV